MDFVVVAAQHEPRCFVRVQRQARRRVAGAELPGYALARGDRDDIVLVVGREDSVATRVHRGDLLSVAEARLHRYQNLDGAACATHAAVQLRIAASYRT